MAENENYIGVAMGLDVTDLKAGLKETSMQIKEANAEFKTAASGMDDWQRSTDGLSAKVKQLDSVLKAQKSALAGMQAEYQKVVASQGEGSDAARKLQLRIQAQQAAVNATQREFNNYTETLNQAKAGNIDLTEVTLRNGKALDTQAASANEAGKGFSSLGGLAAGAVAGIAALGAAVVGAIGGFLSLAESTREFREDQARLNSAFEAASLSATSATETYKTLFGAIGESDTAVEASQQIALLANSSEEAAKWAELATGVVGKFGDALKPETFYEAANETLKLGEATGAYTQMLEQSGYSVDEFNAGLAALNTEEEKQAYMLEISNQLLGDASKAYNETAGEIIKAREAEAALTQATAELGAIAEPIMTTLKLLAVDLLGAITPFVELIGEGLTGAFEGAAGSAETLAEGIGGVINIILEKVMNTIPTILNIILELVPQIAKGLLNSLPTLLSTIVSLVTQVITMLGTLIPDILAKIVEIIPQLINSLADAFPSLLKAATDFLLAIVKAIPTIITALVNALPGIIDTILDTVLNAIPQLIDAAIELLMAIVEAIPTIITALVKALPKIIDTIINAVLKALPLLLDAAIQLFNAILGALPVIIQALSKQVPTIVNTIINTLLKNLPLLINGAIQLFNGILTALPQIITALIKQVPTIVTTIVRVLIQNIPVIINGAIQLFMGIVRAIPQFIGTLIKNMPQIIRAIVRGLASGAGELLKAGKNIVEGIWKGISSGADWLRKKISGFAGDVAGWFKKTFKIKSPSKLMADEVGLYVGEGIGVGVLNSIPYVKKDLAKFSNFVGDNLGNIKSGLAINTSGNTLTGNGISSNGATVVNAPLTVNYNGTLSRKEIRKVQQENDRRVITKLKLQGV